MQRHRVPHDFLSNGYLDKGTVLAYNIDVDEIKKGAYPMNAATQNKNERINLRLKSSAKSLIERAAGFEGKTVSHFILACALEHAEKTVQEHETMALSARDSKIFFDALSAPAPFNRKMKEAMEEHEQRVVSK